MERQWSRVSGNFGNIKRSKKNRLQTTAALNGHEEWRSCMNEDVFNMSVRTFLKKVGVTSQREIEDAIRAAIASGRLKGNEALPAKVTLTVDGIDLSVQIEGAVELE